MRLKFANQFRVKWIDAWAESAWTDDKELEKLIAQFEKPIDQTLYFIKSSNEFHLFTSGKPEVDKPYVDIHAIPKNWIVSITKAR